MTIAGRGQEVKGSSAPDKKEVSKKRRWVFYGEWGERTSSVYRVVVSWGGGGRGKNEVVHE